LQLGATYGLDKDVKVDVDHNDPAHRPLDEDAKLDLGSNEPTSQLEDKDTEMQQEWVQSGEPLRSSRWVQLQVKHFQSLSILSKLRSQPNIEDVKITLLAVKKVGMGIEPWRDTISKLFLATPDGVQLSTGGGGIFYAEAVIKCLETKIQQGHNTKNADRIFQAFASDLFKFIGNIHCEMVLAALMQYINKIEYNDEDLAWTLKVIVPFKLMFVDLMCCTERK